MEAAASRVILEQQAVHARSEWMARMERSWRHAGHVPGGLVYSLEPLDQARILATNFHHLLERLVQADVPVRLLSFPRLVEDADYLFDQLHDFLPEDLDRAKARAAHACISDHRKVRVGRELRLVQSHPTGRELAVATSVGDLDRIAMAREIERLRRRLAETENRERQPNDVFADLQCAVSWAARTMHTAVVGLFSSHGEAGTT